MDYKSIGSNIRECRKSKGIKQEQLAEMVDLSVRYMSALERGVKLPKLETFIRIANALEVSSDKLLSGVVTVGNKFIASELSEQISKLPQNEQKRVINVIKTMITDIN